MPEKIIIFGIKTVAQIVLNAIRDDGHSEIEVCGFCVDRTYYNDKALCGLPVVPFEEVEIYFPPQEYKMLVAIGFHKLNTVRAQKCAEAKAKGYKLASFVHSQADISSSATIGENCIVLNNVSVEPFASVGNNVCLYCNTTISHHSTIGDNCWIASGSVVGGESSVGHNCFLGICSIVGHSIIIGSNNFIGAGAKVTRNTEDESVFVVQDTPKYRLNTKQFMRFSHFA